VHLGAKTYSTRNRFPGEFSIRTLISCYTTKGDPELFSKLFNLFRPSSKEDKCGCAETPSVQIKTSVVMSSSSSSVSSARKLLKEATQLKKSKEYDAACEKLREAYEASDANELMVKERLRLPMYLQLAGKNDEGWKALNELNVEYIDVFSQAEIANQMRVFLQKEKQFKKAIIFSIWSIAKEIERDVQGVEGSIDNADKMAELRAEYDFLEYDDEKEIHGYTPNGNPITDYAYELFLSRLTEAKSIEGIHRRIEKDMKKAKLLELTRGCSKLCVSQLAS
jgi:hypothetical protein